MKWDGLACAEIVKESLYKIFPADELEKAAAADNNKEYADFLKKRHKFSSHCCDGIDVTANAKGISITFFRNEKNDVIINELGDNIIELTWSMAARHLRAWAMENKVTTQYSIEWDEIHHYEAIKSALMDMLTEADKEEAAKMSAEDFSSVLKENYGTYDGYRGAEKSEIRYINRNPNKIAFCIPEKGSNPPVEYEICVPWEIAAEHIVSWVKEEKPKSEMQQKWEDTHLCGGIYGDEHCENLLYSTKDLTEYNGKALDVYCVYCTANGKARKIASASSWTGLTPKWCKKRQEAESSPEQQRKINEANIIDATATAFAVTPEQIKGALDYWKCNLPYLSADKVYDYLIKTEQSPVGGWLECHKTVFKNLKAMGKLFALKEEDVLSAEKKEQDRMSKGTEGTKMMPTFDFSAFSSQDNQLKMIPIDMLDYNNDYERYDGEQFTDMVESIKKNGILQPLIVQAKADGRFYILAGNNRRYCGEAAGVQMFPCIVKENLTDEEAQAYIDETNVYQRGFTSLKITKQAEVIARRHSQMFDETKLKAIQREIALMNGEETADEEQPKGEKTSKLAQVGQEYGLSKDSIARLIRIHKLVPELKPCVDDGRIAVRTAVNLSYLFVSEQRKVAEMLTDGGYSVDMKKSALLKKISEKKQLNDLVIEAVIKGQYNPEGKPSKPKQFKIKAETAQKYFEPEWEDDKIQEVIEAALEMYFNFDVEKHITESISAQFDSDILNMGLSEKSLNALSKENIHSLEDLRNTYEYREMEFQKAVGLMVYDEVMRKLPAEDDEDNTEGV